MTDTQKQHLVCCHITSQMAASFIASFGLVSSLRSVRHESAFQTLKDQCNKSPRAREQAASSRLSRCLLCICLIQTCMSLTELYKLEQKKKHICSQQRAATVWHSQSYSQTSWGFNAAMWQQSWVPLRRESASFWRVVNGVRGGEFHGQFGRRKRLWSGRLCKQLVMVLARREASGAQTNTHIHVKCAPSYEHVYVDTLMCPADLPSSYSKSSEAYRLYTNETHYGRQMSFFHSRTKCALCSGEEQRLLLLLLH